MSIAQGGTLGRLHHALYEQAHEMAGKGASPTMALVDSQSVKGGRGALTMPLRGPEKAQEAALAISEYLSPLAQGARPRAPEPAAA